MSLMEKFRSAFRPDLEVELDRAVLEQRAHRIQLLRPDVLVCQIGSGEDACEARVKDISESGVGFLSEDWPHVKVGDVFSVVFRTERKSFATEIEITRIGGVTLGARVLADANEWKAFLRENFELEIEASTLHLVDPRLLKKPERGEAWWFFSPEGRELYLRVEAVQVKSFHLVFRGHYFEGKGATFLYGRVRDDAKTDAPGIKESHQVIEGDAAPVEDARRFVSNVENLPESYLRQILACLKVSREI